MPADQSRAVREHFERVSARWGKGYEPRPCYMSHLDLQERRLHIQRLLGSLLAADTTRLRVLDLGCGTGDVLQGVSRDRVCVVGVDLAPEMVAVAAQVHPEDRFAACDAARTPFRPGTFDVVVSAGVLEYVPDAFAVLRGAHGLLRPGGHLILSMPNRASLLRKLSRFEEACERPFSQLWRRVRGLPANDGPRPGYAHTHWTPSAGRRLLRDCGFAVHETLYNTYGMRGWLGSIPASLRLSAWLTRRFAENEFVSAWLAHTIVFKARRVPA